MSTKPFDPHTRPRRGTPGSRAATSATIGASIRLLKSVLRIAGSPGRPKANPKTGNHPLSLGNPAPNHNSPQVPEEDNHPTRTTAPRPSRYHLITIIGTTPPPPPTNKTSLLEGAPDKKKLSTDRPTKIEPPTYPGWKKGESGEFARRSMASSITLELLGAEAIE